MLGNRSILILASALIFIEVGSRASTDPIVEVMPEQLAGTWEALVQSNGICTPQVYQMVFVSPHQAWLIEASAGSGLAHALFIGRLVSQDIVNGEVTLKFEALPGPYKSDYLYESEFALMEITGRASGTVRVKTISGKISRKDNNGKVRIDPVLFFDKPWTRAIAEASTFAETTLREVRGTNDKEK